MRNEFIRIYLDWINNFLTIEKFAEHYGLYENEAQLLIELGRSCFEKPHPDE